MQNLQIHNPHFITYADEHFTIDVLGGVDVQQIERMYCTLKVTHKDYPPYRTTLDLYTDSQIEKLIRTLCDKWGVTLVESSKSVHALINQLETYKLEHLRYPQGIKEKAFEMSESEEKSAKEYLSDKNLITNLKNDLEKIGILGEEENALTLFLAMASHKSANPFSVLCLAKSGIGKSYLLQKLSQCMPQNAYSFHTQISENALYYFDSKQIDGKALFIEDLEWTNEMLTPLATLQAHGKLIKTRATKDKDGMLHSTTFEVAGKLCLIACAYSDKNYEQSSLPFLCLHLNHSNAQDITIMEYQKKIKAGLINQTEIAQTLRQLQCVIVLLKKTSIINPYATYINLPEDLPHPRKTLLLLLNFIDAITFFCQYQREEHADQNTGEIQIKTAPEDIEMAFALLKNSLFRRADELSTNARGFFNWLQHFLQQAKTTQFTALDIRKAKRIHPRTLNRYLQELTLFQYIQVAGGNKYREGYTYKITNLNENNTLKKSIETALQKTLETIKAEDEQGERHEETKKNESTKVHEITQEPTPPLVEGVGGRLCTETEPQPRQTTKRIRIEEKEEYTLRQLLELETQQPQRTYLPEDLTIITGRSHTTEARYLRILWEQGRLNREWNGRQYYYTFATTDSETAGQTPPTNLQTSDN